MDITTVLRDFSTIHDVVRDTIQQQSLAIQALATENATLRSQLEELRAALVSTTAAESVKILEAGRGGEPADVGEDGHLSESPMGIRTTVTTAADGSTIVLRGDDIAGGASTGFDADALRRSLLDMATLDDSPPPHSSSTTASNASGMFAAGTSHSHGASTGSSAASTNTALNNNGSTGSQPFLYIFVAFKRDRVYCFTSTESYPLGHHVVVSADRGEDIGIVRSVASTLLSHMRVRGSVLRAANKDDVQCMDIISRDIEQKCLDVCRLLVTRKRLPMEVVDVAVQYDRKKITFFYTSTSRIDFRMLVTELFQLFHARIWMEKVS